MKPGDHPEFFRLPAPPGRSRESTIRLDGEGRFFHEEVLVDNPKLALALHTWIQRHPDDGRFILSNGYDWTYFKVDDVPYFVRSLRADGDHLVASLSDGSEEPLDAASIRSGDAHRTGDALYASVKSAHPGGPYDAKFSRSAQTALAPFLREHDGRFFLEVNGKSTALAGFLS